MQKTSRFYRWEEERGRRFIWRDPKTPEWKEFIERKSRKASKRYRISSRKNWWSPWENPVSRKERWVFEKWAREDDCGVRKNRKNCKITELRKIKKKIWRSIKVETETNIKIESGRIRTRQKRRSQDRPWQTENAWKNQLSAWVTNKNFWAHHRNSEQLACELSRKGKLVVRWAEENVWDFGENFQT